MVVPKPPIIIVDGFDVSLHSSIDEAEKWLEPWSVRQSAHKIFDALGHLLSAVVVVDKAAHLFGTSIHEKVRILMDDPVVDASGELKCALIGHLKASEKVQASTHLERASIEVLISLIERRK